MNDILYLSLHGCAKRGILHSCQQLQFYLLSSVSSSSLGDCLFFAVHFLVFIVTSKGVITLKLQNLMQYCLFQLLVCDSGTEEAAESLGGYPRSILGGPGSLNLRVSTGIRFFQEKIT